MFDFERLCELMTIECPAGLDEGYAQRYSAARDMTGAYMDREDADEGSDSSGESGEAQSDA